MVVCSTSPAAAQLETAFTELVLSLILEMGVVSQKPNFLKHSIFQYYSAFISKYSLKL